MVMLNLAISLSQEQHLVTPKTSIPFIFFSEFNCHQKVIICSKLYWLCGFYTHISLMLGVYRENLHHFAYFLVCKALHTGVQGPLDWSHSL